MILEGRPRTIAAASAAALLVAGIVGGALWFNREREVPLPDPVAATVPVAIEARGLPADTRIGVVLTFGSGSASGAQWNQAAQGAVVARERLEDGGTPVELVTEGDGGTAEGARDAVAALAADGVSGIVIATEGGPATAAARAAADAGLPSILPYAPAPDGVEGAWSTAPAAEETAAAVESLLEGRENVLLVSSRGESGLQLDTAQSLPFAAGDDADALAADVAFRSGVPGAPDPDGSGQPPAPADAVDAVVLDAAPAEQAALVTAMQSLNVQVPLVLTPDAVSPAFATALAERGGTASGQLATVGGRWGDAIALQQDPPGRAMSAFLTALRLAASDDSVANLTDDAPFRTMAEAADVRSHDAVVAFALASAAAGSAEPADVSTVLSTVVLAPGNGGAGPELDFASPQAFDQPLSPAYAAQQDLGLRPSDGSAGALLWISDSPAP